MTSPKDTMKKPLLLLLLLSLTTSVLAEYMIPKFPNALASSSHVVDATVTEITKEKYARLTIHQHLKGTNAPLLLTGTSLTCIPGPPGAYGMQAKKRYLIMLSGPNLYEETTFFEVITDTQGQPGCKLNESHQKWMGITNAWTPLDQMKQLLTSQNPK